MPETFFTADWHLGDPRLELLGRPFADAEAMAEELVARHNELVAPEDTVYILGDALHQEAEPALWLPLIGRFNGEKILFRGNHDRLSDAELAPYFTEIVPEGDGLELELDGLPCWATHYPSRGRADRFNLVGHIHGTWRVQKNMLNCGVDAHHFRPLPSTEVGFYYKAICEFYDQDVWCAEQAANAAHYKRGKPGTYFETRQAEAKPPRHPWLGAIRRVLGATPR